MQRHGERDPVRAGRFQDDQSLRGATPRGLKMLVERGEAGRTLGEGDRPWQELTIGRPARGQAGRGDIDANEAAIVWE